MNILFALSLFAANGLDIDIWLDRDDAAYVPTENVTLFFRTNEDCYVAVYNVEVGGREARLFPPGEPETNDAGWVEAGRTYTLPPETADYEYVIVGPEGTEQVIVLASKERLPGFYDTGPDIVSETIEIFIREPEPATLIIFSTPDKSRIFITDVETDETEYVGKTPQHEREVAGHRLQPGGVSSSRRLSGLRSAPAGTAPRWAPAPAA